MRKTVHLIGTVLMTKYRHTLVYRIDGIHLGAREQAEIIAGSVTDFHAVLTTDPDPYCFEGDRFTALADLMLNAAFRGSEISEERLASGLEAIRESRKRKFGTGPYLIFVREDDVEDFSPRRKAETEDFVICWDGAPKDLLRQVSEPRILAALGALVIAAEDVSKINKVSDSLIFFRRDGKPIYSYTSSFTARPSVLREIPEETVGSVTGWYRIIAQDRRLERVNRLLVSSLQTEDDALRSFLSAWTAIEIFINKTFRSYEERLFRELNDGDYPDARRQYLERIRSVMRDKHRLTDKFALIASLLCPEDADEDVEQLRQAKEDRDKLSHGQDIREDRLSVRTVQELIRKYLRLHLTG